MLGCLDINFMLQLHTYARTKISNIKMPLDKVYYVIYFGYLRKTLVKLSKTSNM